MKCKYGNCPNQAVWMGYCDDCIQAMSPAEGEQ